MALDVTLDGQKIEGCNIRSIAVSRPPARSGQIGMTDHMVHLIELERDLHALGLQLDPAAEAKIQELASKQDNPYFAGEVCIMQNAAPQQVLKRFSWEQGHMVLLRLEGGTEVIAIAVTKLLIDDAAFVQCVA